MSRLYNPTHKSPLTVLYFLNGKITNKTDFKLIKTYRIGRKSVSGLVGLTVVQHSGIGGLVEV